MALSIVNDLRWKDEKMLVECSFTFVLYFRLLNNYTGYGIVNKYYF